MEPPAFSVSLSGLEMLFSGGSLMGSRNVATKFPAIIEFFETKFALKLILGVFLNQK